MPPPDVPDPEGELARYNRFHAEQFVALMNRPVPRARRFELDCLPEVDHHFWREDYPARAGPEPRRGDGRTSVTRICKAAHSSRHCRGGR